MRKRKTIGIMASAALVVLAYLAPALADENNWSTGGPDGASVQTIAVHPTDTLRLYIGTVHSGIFQTVDGGAEWSRIEDDTLDRARALRIIKFHPFGPDTVFAAACEGLFKSADAGQTWFRLPFPYPENEHRAFEIHPDDPLMLFTDGLFWPYKSTDGGETWYRCIGGIPTIVNVEELKVDPINTNVVYFTGGCDYKSTDYGENWHNIRPDPFETGTNGISIAIDPVNSEIVYLGRHDYRSVGTCLYKSTNGGDDWRDITPPGLVGCFVSDVVVSPLDHDIVFITTDGDGIFRSADGGRNWEEINEGLVVRNARRMVIDPDTGNLYLGLYYDGIYRSTNNGDSWEKISYNVTGAHCTDIAANRRNPDTLYTTTHAGLFISTDGAESWERIILNIPYHQFTSHQVEVDPYDPSYVYLPVYGLYAWPASGAFYRSTDGGSTWESFTQGLPDRACYSIAVADYGDGRRRLFMGIVWAGLYFSDDLGQSWSLCRGGLPSNITFMAIDASPVNPEIVFAGDYESDDVYKSTDGGANWVELDMPRGEYIREIVCDPVDEDIVYVIIKNWSGIFKSIDGGQTWDNIDNNLPRDHEWCQFCVSGIAINPLNHDNIFVYSFLRGVYESHDGGQYWEEFYHESLRKGTSAATLVDPVDTSRVLLAQYGQSVWWIKRTQTGIDDNRDVLPVAFSTSSYPNPFNPSAAIEYSLPEEASVTVEIYDLLGRKVETLVSEDQPAGRYQVMWNAKDRASGLYFYRINAGQYSTTGIMTLLK